MAIYKGIYNDIYKDKATYDVQGKETKTVKGESAQDYKAGLNLTIESGKLEIRAETLLDTAKILNWDIDDTHDTKAGSLSVSVFGANVNAFGFFMVQSKALAWASGQIVTSNGVVLWVNANPIQVLMTRGKLTAFSNAKKANTGKKFSLSGIRLVTVTSEHVNAKTSKTS